MSLGEIDTLNLTFEKLQSLFDESQGYYESFLDANNLYKAGKLTDKEFFQKLGDYTVAYSALEFLAIKSLMEMKKTLDRVSSGAGGGTQSPGLMPGMGQPGMMPGMNPGARVGTEIILLAVPLLLCLLLKHLVKLELYHLLILHYFLKDKVQETVLHVEPN